MWWVLTITIKNNHLLTLLYSTLPTLLWLLALLYYSALPCSTLLYSTLLLYLLYSALLLVCSALLSNCSALHLQPSLLTYSTFILPCFTLDYSALPSALLHAAYHRYSTQLPTPQLLYPQLLGFLQFLGFQHFLRFQQFLTIPGRFLLDFLKF